MFEEARDIVLAGFDFIYRTSAVCLSFWLFILFLCGLCSEEEVVKVIDRV